MKRELCMNEIIIEVGSTCTKIDKFDGSNIKRLDEKTIEFKKNYLLDKKLRNSDIYELINIVLKFKEISEKIYICGTSIFRDLKDYEKAEFLNKFKDETGYDFNIISQEEENHLTVYGATKNVKQKVCVFVGGGGSTEISVYDGKILESVNSKIGVIDVMKKYEDLADDIATTDIKEIKEFLKVK